MFSILAVTLGHCFNALSNDITPIPGECVCVWVGGEVGGVTQYIEWKLTVSYLNGLGSISFFREYI